MRYELYNHLAASAVHALRMLQEVADDPNVHKAITSGPSDVHPNLNGCVDSPEASTMVLMLVGTIGIYFGSMFFTRMSRRREARNQAATL
jgi:XrtJ-associated TM-motif-TM protein